MCTTPSASPEVGEQSTGKTQLTLIEMGRFEFLSFIKVVKKIKIIPTYTKHEYLLLLISLQAQTESQNATSTLWPISVTPEWTNVALVRCGKNSN